MTRSNHSRRVTRSALPYVRTATPVSVVVVSAGAAWSARSRERAAFLIAFVPGSASLILRARQRDFRGRQARKARAHDVFRGLRARRVAGDRGEEIVSIECIQDDGRAGGNGRQIGRASCRESGERGGGRVRE